jgi:hypothetical protein
MGRPTSQFCKRGHDTFDVGRFSNGWCRACSADESRVHRGRGKGNWGDKPTRHPIKWERKRVKRWLEIVSADPMHPYPSTQRRYQDFKERLEQLEADVPTPVEI